MWSEPEWFRTDRGNKPHPKAGESFNMASDPAQKDNRYAAEPDKVKELTVLMERYASEGHSTPCPKQKNDGNTVWDNRDK